MSDLPQRHREHRGEGSGASGDGIGGRGESTGGVAFHLREAVGVAGSHTDSICVTCNGGEKWE